MIFNFSLAFRHGWDNYSMALWFIGSIKKIVISGHIYTQTHQRTSPGREACSHGQTIDSAFSKRSLILTDKNKTQEKKKYKKATVQKQNIVLLVLLLCYCYTLIFIFFMAVFNCFNFVCKTNWQSEKEKLQQKTVLVFTRFNFTLCWPKGQLTLSFYALCSSITTYHFP